jgi:hypothetical protein
MAWQAYRVAHYVRLAKSARCACLYFAVADLELAEVSASTRCTLMFDPDANRLGVKMDPQGSNTLAVWKAGARAKRFTGRVSVQGCFRKFGIDLTPRDLPYRWDAAERMFVIDLNTS